MTNGKNTPRLLTSREQGMFYEFFQKADLPPWFTSSSSVQRRVLYESLIACFSSREAGRAALAPLESPEQFSSRLLTAKLSEKLKEPINITGGIFQHVRSVSSLLGLRKKLVLPIERDLLTAACEGFTNGETSPGNYHKDSLIYLPERVTGHGNKILGIQPHEFAQLCRDLDMGKRYQEGLEQLLEKDASVRQKCLAHSRHSFELDMHIARMKNTLSENTYLLLKEALAESGPSGFVQGSFAVKTLQLLDCTLYGALLFTWVKDHRCVLYLPGDPDQALIEYSSSTNAEVDLSNRLRQIAFKEYFERFIAFGELAGFRDRLKTRLLDSSIGSALPARTRYLQLTQRDVAGDGFSALHLHRVGLLKANARILIVPNEDEDELERLKRLETYEAVGINVGLWATSFLPVVGELLMAVSAFQLMKTAYLGIDSWVRGDLEQAADYFFDTVENLAVTAALSAGHVAVKGTYKIVGGSRLVNQLRQVKLPDGQMRLWKSDLAAYRRNVTLPAWLKPDSRGLRTLGGNSFLRLDHHLFAVRPQADTDMWEMLPLPSVQDHLPLLETNNHGAWRHDSELPQEWDRLTLFRRLGYAEEVIDDARALQVLAASNTQEGVLRQSLLDRSLAPGVLIDTAQRFEADQAVSRFIARLKTPQADQPADGELQLQLLLTLAKWPPDAALSITDTAAETLKRFAPTGKVIRDIKLKEEAVRTGTFHATVLSGLTVAEREAMLGLNLSHDDQVKALKQLLLDQAGNNSHEVFSWIYRRDATPVDDKAAVLIQKYPELPNDIANELVRYADTPELLELDAANVPLRLAEEARRYLQVIRENRAFEGLYLSALGNVDTDRLVLDALDWLPGWKGDLYLEINEWRSGGDVASMGNAEALDKLFFWKLPRFYQLVDSDRNTIAFRDSRSNAHYFQVLWEGLSPERRVALGVEATDGALLLQQKITAVALQRREFAHLTIGGLSIRPGYKSPMRLADRLQPVSRPAPSTSQAGATTHSAVLRQRAQELYPAHSAEQVDALLSRLGADEVLALRALEKLRIEFFGLRDTLQKWIHRETWHQPADGTRVKVTRQAKSRAAQQIIRCWRRETPAQITAEGKFYELSLMPLVVGDLPTLTGDFSHVGTLLMDRVGLGAGAGRFLESFTQLRTLSLVGNQLERLPNAISAMSKLETLDLSENQILLTVVSQTMLAGLTSLKRLNVSSNPGLGRAPNVTRLVLLEQLNLRETGISEWPEGATQLSQLRTLDMRDNSLVEIPEAVFRADDRMNQGTDIRGNPLSAQTLNRVRLYQQARQIGLGLIASIQITEVARVLVDLSTSASWLSGVTGELLVTRLRLWRELFVFADSRQFFSLLIRLRHTADYRFTYASLSERVWSMIVAAKQNTELRKALFRMARTSASSIDGYSMLFSDLSVMVLCHQAMHAPREGGATLEQDLVGLMRGLFRLQKIETVALKKIIEIRRTAIITDDQAMQVGFAFRVGLAERLRLPGQPTELNRRLDVEVTAFELDKAYEEVTKVEGTSALLEWFNGQPFWSSYIERRFHEQFESIDLRAQVAFAALDGQPQFTHAQFGESMRAIVHNHSNDRRSLFNRLSLEILGRNPGLAPSAPRGRG